MLGNKKWHYGADKHGTVDIRSGMLRGINTIYKTLTMNIWHFHMTFKKGIGQKLFVFRTVSYRASKDLKGARLFMQCYEIMLSK